MVMLTAVAGCLLLATCALAGPGCNVDACTHAAGSVSCTAAALFAQGRAGRMHVAASFHGQHPAQTYLVDANPFPPGYATLANVSARLAVGMLRLPALDYCYRIERMPGYDTDLMGLVKVVACTHADALPARGFLLSFKNAFVNLHGSEYINSLQVFSCQTHAVFGGCNENVPLTGPHLLAGVDDAIVIDRAVAVMTRWGWSFYHWLIEELPRIVYAARLLAEDPELRVLAHDSPHNRFIFDLLGVGQERIVPVRGSRMHFVRHLFVPPVAHCGRPAIAASQQYRRTLRKNMERLGIVERGVQATHIVVVQRDGGRHTANHAELMAALAAAFPDATFVAFGPHAVPLNETARVFGLARGVVAVHGAGISNIVFTPASAFLVEFHPGGSNQNTHPNFCHQGTASAYGMRHKMVWLRDGEFNDGVHIPVQLAIAAICELDGGPPHACGSTILQRLDA